MEGKATITLHPHFYATDSLVLNAREMILNEVSILNKDGKHLPVTFSYDDSYIHLKFSRRYTREESVTVYIEYVARPELIKQGGSSAIKSDKGLFFINADGKDPDKPKQLWTQGETESNSAWFPTIESPEQKMTQEIYLTVDTFFQTLSNGLLLSSELLPDGTRRDYWKQSLPAAPYLSMIAVGKFAVTKERWKNIEVSYYVDPNYEKYTRLIFGHTPEIMSFFSQKLGIDFVWEKYAQVVVHDYISGAMENATAVVQGTNMQQDSSEYYDGNYEEYISHELFHHWFGNLVTCKSWSNITLNEGFANYSEYLWDEYKFGRDEADYGNQLALARYFYISGQKDPPIIRYEYNHREDMYDEISYHKAGRVLHMLRKYTGDDAFFASLHDYLQTNKYGTADIDDLRHSFEKITGEDLHWFFDEWYLKGGFPLIDIRYDWNDSTKKMAVQIDQKQNFKYNPLYKIPIDIDIYFNDTVERHRVIVDDAQSEITFTLTEKPKLVNVDAEKMLLCRKTDHKSREEFIYQYYHAPLYMDRFEALAAIGDEYRTGTPASQMIKDALHDKFWNLRLSAINKIGELAKNNPDSIRPELLKLAQYDSSSHVRDAAWKALNKYFPYKSISDELSSAGADRSCLVKSRLLKIAEEKDLNRAFLLASQMENDSCDDIMTELSAFYTSDTTRNKNDFYQRAYRQAGRFSRYTIVKNYGKYLAHITTDSIREPGVDFVLKKIRSEASRSLRNSLMNVLKDIRSSIDDQLQSENKHLRELEQDKTSTSYMLLEEHRAITKLQNQLDALTKRMTDAENAASN